jgi:hypothetical protein
MLGPSASLILVILRLLAGVCPLYAPGVQTVQTSPIRGGSEVVQIKVGGRDRGVSHPRLHGHWVNSARQPQARGRVPQVVNASAFGNSGPSECPLEGRGVELVAGLGHK